MTRQQIKTMLDSYGLPYAYHHFAEGEAPSLPFVVYYFPDSNNFAADDTVYHKAIDLTIELYSKKRDLDKEWQLEDELYLYDLFWQKHEVYIESEKMYMVRYEMEAVVMG